MPLLTLHAGRGREQGRRTDGGGGAAVRYEKEIRRYSERMTAIKPTQLAQDYKANDT